MFRAVALLQAAARGDLSRELALEGGLSSALWAGPTKKGPVRVTFAISLEDLRYELTLGAPRCTDAALEMDAVVKEEKIFHTGRRGKAAEMLSRKGPFATGRDDQGGVLEVSRDLWLFETALSRLSDPRATPEAARLKALLADVAVYDGFRVDAASPLRAPQPRVATPTVAADGRDWAAALYTRIALGDGFEDFDRSPAVRAIDAAFPGARPSFFEEGFSVEGGITAPEFDRPFRARELSEGTLRFLALVATLTALRPPGAILLNEPEASLNPRLIPPLASLIAEAADRSQVLVATHDHMLADQLDVEHGARRLRLAKEDGETVLV